MDRKFDYTQKILLAVEFADAPRRLEGMPATYARFKRLSIPDVVRAFDDTQNLFVQMIAGRKFRNVLEQHMGYWEKGGAGRQAMLRPLCHRPPRHHHGCVQPDQRGRRRLYIIGRLSRRAANSAYPFSFPFGDTPDHWRLGEHFSLTEDSVFWFNFFPEQPYLFEKTFAVWALFQMLQLAGRGENNQLVAFDGRESLIAQGVSDFVLVNLNRFTSLPGFFNAAHEAGKHTFTVDPDYIWYGMLLKKM
jgi:hypothetical protein